MSAKGFLSLLAASAACLGLWRGTAGAADALIPGAGSASGDEFLPVAQAFHFKAEASGAEQITLRWLIAPGYYLYRDRIKLSSDSTEATLGQPTMPAGIQKQDQYFGPQVIYHDELTVPVSVSHAGSAAFTLPLKVSYQGCAEAGLCYPPVTQTLNIQMPAGQGSTSAGNSAASSATSNTSADGAVASSPASGSGGQPGYVSQQDWLASVILNDNVFVMLGVFFASGLLLAFTPCVLPMVPILARLIAGQGQQVNTRRAFLLALVYVLGMAVTYSAAGAVAGLAGKQVQAALQQTWVVLLFAALMVAMALSMFGAFTLQMPAALQTRLSGVSNRQQAGSYVGVAVMGALGALIVTTCTAPALVAALVVIGQTGNVARGASALFAMSLGMGVPLLAVGTSAGVLLPKAGAWMDGVKRLFGVLMLGMAAWMLSRVLNGPWTLVSFAIPALLGAWVLWGFAPRGTPQFVARVLGVAVAAYGALLLSGAARGHGDVLAPWRSPAAVAAEALPFQTIKSVDQLDAAVRDAQAAGRPVLLDFYADWCTSCKEMERYTFTDPQVKQTLGRAVLLRADVTANDDVDQALLARFRILGPPTIAFYGPQGQERAEYRVVGYMKAAEFAAVLRQALAST
ncbi:MAG: protein-disulfide reductase DsbD [Steroidobacteraceae bacterium]